MRNDLEQSLSGLSRVLLDVGFTVSPMRREVSATDYAQVFAADTAANEVSAFTVSRSVSAEFTIVSVFTGSHVVCCLNLSRS